MRFTARIRVDFVLNVTGLSLAAYAEAAAPAMLETAL